MVLCLRLCAFLLVVSAVTGSAEEKRLHWRSLDVTGHLDADGHLQISERHTMVFNGDWNGGERKFDIRLGQELDLRGISRVDASGTMQPLREGDLDAVDEWQWYDTATLRWRSRLPSDPLFQDTAITYVLEYSISNVLRPSGGTYVLRHDFAFPQRAGVIESFSARLTADGVWSALSPLPASGRQNLQPGESAVVEARFRYLPSGHPAGVERGVPVAFGWLVAAVLLPFVGAVCIRHFFAEARAGAFAPLFPIEQINDAWLQENLLNIPPEVIGATWDDTTSGPEVAAVLARMTVERKLATRIETGRFGRANGLYLKLLVSRDALAGYEANLVKALFFNGDETSTSLIREHYRKRGFDPASIIRGPIEKMSARLTGKAKRRSGRGERAWKSPALMMAVSVILLLLTGFTSAQNWVAAAAGSGIIVALMIFGIIGAFSYSGRVTNMKLATLGYTVPIFLIVATVCSFLLLAPASVPLSSITLIGLATFAAAAVMVILFLARIPDVDERFELRRRLAAARGYFKWQLRSRNPALRDEWFPYLLAFGLGARVDRWFRAFGTGPQSPSGSFGSTSGSSASAAGGGGWSGGGGSFGGAGASGSWAVAAGALGAGVSTPGSSSGGGGGSSSGGGGGGGW